ncbi:MAG: Rne/Rng family ribonuclease [Candidatus Coatesbacteria bacterium]|nr:MAG: Rne/Rng family ribonuclease [Candidatus Coatesbacteria bacterium]
MYKEILIDSSLEETRVAVIENGKLVELYMEERDVEYHAGDIYKAVVEDVLPGLQSAFLDVGHGRKGFLHGADVISTGMEEIEELLNENVGSPGGTKDYYGSPIQDTLREGQEVIVQILKEPIGEKGAKLTTAISIPGRYLVLMPYADKVNVSNRIKDRLERERLRDLINGIRPHGIGFIIRTAAKGVEPEYVYGDMEELVGVWRRINEQAGRKRAPCLLYKDRRLLHRTIRDIFTEDVDILIVDDLGDYEETVKSAEKFSPGLSQRVRLYEDDEPLFEAFGVESEINSMFRRKVWLRSGGYIVIDETEALVAIDVNTGRFLGRKDLEETILKTNLEAAAEIARQVRLRNVGGIIIIDFIDMAIPENRHQVIDAFKGYLENDRARVNILELSELGLVEMTRQRMRESLLSHISRECPSCKGRGSVLTIDALIQKIESEVRRGFRNLGGELILTVHPDIKDFLDENYAGRLNQIEHENEGNIFIQSDDGFALDGVEVSPAGRVRKTVP